MEAVSEGKIYSRSIPSLMDIYIGQSKLWSDG